MDAGTVAGGPTRSSGPAQEPDRLLELVWRRQRQWSRVADAARRRLDRWRLWDLGLLVLGALAGAMAAQTWVAAGVGLSTWTAAAATIAAVLGAHLAAAQHEGIAAAYAATADQLETLVAGFYPASAPPDRRAEFVTAVERVLAAQNQGWTDLLGPRPAGREGALPWTT